MYRKKERLDKSYAKEPLLAFLKAILVQSTLNMGQSVIIKLQCLLDFRTSSTF